MSVGLLVVALAACKREPFVPDFTVRPGVEIATVLDAGPGDTLTLYDSEGTALMGMITDDLGQAHFAYVPDDYMVIDSRDGGRFPILDGGVLKTGDYEIKNDATDPPQSSGPFHVLAIDELPPVSLYEGQTLTGEGYSAITGDLGDPESGYQYLEVRDGVLLGVMVRFPDPLLYGDGPYPTVIEYSGYSPSRPDGIEPGTLIANALGYATVAVNMRGTGCSGGVYDVFNRAEHADGYDVVEAVARQPWVLHNKVGMVGLSYPGISQLFVASTAPPSLAGIVPESVIADGWEMQWPGGLYNEGFTKSWIGERESEAASGGTSWVDERIAAGDTICEANARLGTQNIDFESFFHELKFRPRDADDRDLNHLVEQITAPVFLAGAWQDEQTGAQFGNMLDRFTQSPHARFTVYNGRHPDGYGPEIAQRWYEFLEFYVAQRVPRIGPLIRTFAAPAFGAEFGYDGYEFGADRFDAYTDDQYAEALAAYESEPAVRVLFEVGGAEGPPGLPTARFETAYEQWPPTEVVPSTWYLDGSGALAAHAPTAAGADVWAFDPGAADDTFFGPSGYQLMTPLWDLDWQPFAAGDVVSYVTAPFADATVLAGPGIAKLWVLSPTEAVVQVQVTLSEVRPDGNEVLVQSGWLDLGHRKATEAGQLRLHRTYSQVDYEPVPVSAWVEADVAIPSFAHPFRSGSALRVTVSTPGRNHGTWEFEAPPYDGTPVFHLGRGGDHASALELTTLPGIAIPAGMPPCPSLRGQPCRVYAPSANVVAE